MSGKSSDTGTPLSVNRSSAEQSLAPAATSASPHSLSGAALDPAVKPTVARSCSGRLSSTLTASQAGGRSNGTLEASLDRSSGVTYGVRLIGGLVMRFVIAPLRERPPTIAVSVTSSGCAGSAAG